MTASRPWCGRLVRTIAVASCGGPVTFCLLQVPRYETCRICGGLSAEPVSLRSVLAAIGLVVEGEDRCLDAVLQAEFGEDAADVGLDGLLADCQVPGDLPVAVAAGDEPQYVAFAW